MDAVKFIEERKRLCGTYEICKDCPANGNPGCMFNLNYGADADEQVNFLEAWSAAHPHKTRQSVFLEQYPEASISEHGVLLVCPCQISASHRNAHGGCGNIHRKCRDCRKEFWGQEVK